MKKWLSLYYKPLLRNMPIGGIKTVSIKTCQHNIHMKKQLTLLIAVALFFGLSSTESFAQNTFQPCNAIAHPLFEPAPMGKNPVTLNRLGSSPQFGEIKAHTAKAAYDHLKRVYSKNSARNKREIDNLLQSMGYTGLSDPNFSVASITPETLPAGTTGWMGAYSRGHKYAWSVLGRSFETFKITSVDRQCYVYVMRKCGNAFYDPSVRVLPALAPIAYVPQVKCLTQKITISGKSQIEKTNFVNTTATVQLVAINGSNPELCVGTTQVPIAASYGINANGSVDYSKVVEVCSYGNAGSPAPVSLMSPVQLSVDVTESSVMLGDGGVMKMAVSENQYKQLKKLYGVCASSPTAAAAPTFTKEENGTRVVDDAAASAGTGTKCKTQTMTFAGSSDVKDGSVKTASKNVTVIGRYIKTGALAKGETADKYLCLGTHAMNATLASAFNVKGTSKVMKSLEICDKTGDTPDKLDVNVPVKLDYSVSAPTMNMGDAERIYVDLDANQYKTLSKRFGRCCGVEGNDKCM